MNTNRKNAAKTKEDTGTITTIGEEIRSRRKYIGIELRALAGLAKWPIVMLEEIESGAALPSTSVIYRIAKALNVGRAVRDRWCSLAGHVAPDLAAALLAQPGRWDEVRAILSAKK